MRRFTRYTLGQVQNRIAIEIYSRRICSAPSCGSWNTGLLSIYDALVTLDRDELTVVILSLQLRLRLCMPALLQNIGSDLACLSLRGVVVYKRCDTIWLRCFAIGHSRHARRMCPKSYLSS